MATVDRFGTLRHQDAIAAVRDGGRISRRPGSAPPRLFTLDASVAYAIGGILRRFRAPRGAPAALCAAGRAGAASSPAGRYFCRAHGRAVACRAGRDARHLRPASWPRRKQSLARRLRKSCRRFCRWRWSAPSCVAWTGVGYRSIASQPTRALAPAMAAVARGARSEPDFQCVITPPRRPAVRRRSSDRDRPARVRSAPICAPGSWPSRGRICGLPALRARRSAGTGRN